MKITNELIFAVTTASLGIIILLAAVVELGITAGWW